MVVERPIGEEEKPYEILQQWGIHRDEVKFYLRHELPGPPMVIDGTSYIYTYIILSDT